MLCHYSHSRSSHIHVYHSHQQMNHYQNASIGPCLSVQIVGNWSDYAGLLFRWGGICWLAIISSGLCHRGAISLQVKGSCSRWQIRPCCRWVAESNHHYLIQVSCYLEYRQQRFHHQMCALCIGLLFRSNICQWLYCYIQWLPLTILPVRCCLRCMTSCKSNLLQP